MLATWDVAAQEKQPVEGFQQQKQPKKEPTN